MAMNYALKPTTHQSLTASGSSVASAAFGSQTEYVRIATPADIHILFGASPTASATDRRRADPTNDLRRRPRGDRPGRSGAAFRCRWRNRIRCGRPDFEKPDRRLCRGERAARIGSGGHLPAVWICRRWIGAKAPNRSFPGQTPS